MREGSKYPRQNLPTGKNILANESPAEINGGGRKILDKRSPGGKIFQAESLLKKKMGGGEGEKS